MLEELERRNYSPSTTRCYLRAVHEFARYFNRAPDQLAPDHIRQYQAYLFRERKLEPNTVIQHLGGIRFFYIKTLKQSWSADLTPYPKKALHLPSILSREEVNSLIEAAPTPFGSVDARCSPVRGGDWMRRGTSLLVRNIRSCSGLP